MSLALFNYLESILWFAFALVLALQAYRQPGSQPWRPVALVAAMACVLFGVSDVIEAHTGAWWHPPGLLLLKVACVLTLVACYVWYRLVISPEPDE